MKADLVSAQEQITEVVRQAVEEIFNTMFQVAVLKDSKPLASIPGNIVLVSVKMNHGATDLDFYFRFDTELLLAVASLLFSPEHLKSAPMQEDIACEVANIVCHRVKTYLNEEGYMTDMGFPFIPSPEQAVPMARENLVHMHFFYLDKNADQKFSVAINSVLA